MGDWAEGDEDLFTDSRYATTLATIQALHHTAVSPEAAIGLRVYQGLMHTMWMRRLRDELHSVYSQTLANLQIRMHDVAVMIGDEASEFEDAELEALLQALSDSLEDEEEEETHSLETIESVAPAAKLAEQVLPNKCSVCLDSIEKLQLYRQLDCGHYYHKRCIDTWFERKWSCPMCRVPIA